MKKSSFKARRTKVQKKRRTKAFLDAKKALLLNLTKRLIPVKINEKTTIFTDDESKIPAILNKYKGEKIGRAHV